MFKDIDAELREIQEAKGLLQGKQDELGYDMFNLGVADEWAGLETKISKLEKTEMLLMEKALKKYYEFYPKREE